MSQMPLIVQELRFHLMEHVGGPPPGRAGCRHISCLLSLHSFPSCLHSLLSKSNPFPPLPNFLFCPSLLEGERERGLSVNSPLTGLLLLLHLLHQLSLLLPHSLVGRGWRNPPHPSPIPTLPPKQFLNLKVPCLQCSFSHSSSASKCQLIK